MPEAYTDDPILTGDFQRALTFALDHHHRQLRKGTDIPYAAHLLSVAALVLEMGGDQEEAVAGLLHDVVEDGGGAQALTAITGEFGGRVARIVQANSDTDQDPKPPWRRRKEAYVASLAHKQPDELRVSLADKLHNARSVLLDYRRHGEALWSRFNAGDGAAVLWYYRALADGFRARAGDLGDGGLAAVDELERVVAELERLID